jgi:hypothetical protein
MSKTRSYEEFLEGHLKQFPKTLTASVLLIFLGFILLSFPSVDLFFGEHQTLFYLVFFGPFVGILLAVFLYNSGVLFWGLAIEFRRLYNEKMPFLQLLVEFIPIILEMILYTLFKTAPFLLFFHE